MSEKVAADDEFAARLRELREAAGNPDLGSLVRQGTRQDPPLKLNDATLSDWFAGKAIPSRAKHGDLRFLVEFLEGRAKRSGYQTRGAPWWVALSERARRARTSRARSSAEGDAGPAPYVEQVRQLIAPPRLHGRDAELAELAEFCLDGGAGPYVYWQAGPWAGKSALLSTFVTRPGEELAGRVWLVAFFVTARQAGQDTRSAFVSVLTQQLCHLLRRQPPPAALDEANREAALLDLLRQAAEDRRKAGGRLVLVVDGLDEDRSEGSGPHVHSIAGLLPGAPPAGTRVIVAGRPNPPIPDDVPDWHPLRDPRIVRPLPDSPHAQDLRRLAQAELKRLLKGSPLERDVLGLLTAARGGLTAGDLCELTGSGLVEVEDVLHTVAGRTFARRGSELFGQERPEAYLLGHEELRNAATGYLGDHLLARYRDRLHAWADGYRAQGWPPHTPEYLLTGYFDLVASVGDRRRLVDLATDGDRHDRMLDLIGGDTSAFLEITQAHAAVGGDEPDLCAAARLAVHRTRLADRNAAIPVGLPALWAWLGHPARAEALARAMTGAPVPRARALAALAAALAAAGDRERADELIALAERTAATVTPTVDRPFVQAALYCALVDSGELDAAEGVARRAEDPFEEGGAVVRVALYAAGQPGSHRWRWAERLIRSAGDPSLRAHGLAALAYEIAAGEPEHATGLIAEARYAAETVTDPAGRMRILSGVARALARIGAADEAERLVTEEITEPNHRGWVWLDLCRSAVEAGDRVRALRYARQLEQLTIAMAYARLDEIWERLADLVARAGDHEWAADIARRLSDDPMRPGWLRTRVRLGVAAARDGDRGRVAALAASIRDPDDRAEVLALLSAALAGAGDSVAAERVAGRIRRPHHRGRALQAVSGVRARQGQWPAAERVAHEIPVPELRAQALVALAEAALVGGNTAAAPTWAREAERVARTVRGEDEHAYDLLVLCRAAAHAGHLPRAERLLGKVASRHRAAALTEVITAAAGVADHGRASRLAARLPSALSLIDDPDERLAASVSACVAAARAGDIEWALAEAARIDEQLGGYFRAGAQVATAFVEAGRVDEGMRVAHSLAGVDDRAVALAGIAQALYHNGAAARAMEVLDEAETIARQGLRYTYNSGTDAVTAARVNVGDLDGARRIIDGQPEWFWGTLHPHRVWLILVTSRDLARTEARLRERLTDTDEREAALTQLIEALTERRQLDRARALLDELPVYRRDRGLAASSCGAARAGDWTLAEGDARDIDNGDLRAETLTTLSLHLHGAGEHTHAARLLAEAMSTGRWAGPGLRALPKIAPQAVATIVDEVLGAGATGPSN